MAAEASRENHLYGGQAVLEGVMMRGRDHWAIAVRRPDTTIHLESHEIDSLANRYRFLRWPGPRGVIALGQALSIGFRALLISANQATPEDEQLTKKQMAISMTLALALFVGIFLVAPAIGFKFVQHHLRSSVAVNMLEGVFRVALFLGYLALIGRKREERSLQQGPEPLALRGLIGQGTRIGDAVYDGAARAFYRL